jgi:hypothetical protein
MSPFATLFAGPIAAAIMTSTVANAQNFEVKRYNPSPWTKTFFTEIVTVNGPGKTIYLAGVGAEDENGQLEAFLPFSISVMLMSSAATPTIKLSVRWLPTGIIGGCGQAGGLRHRRSIPV